MSEEKTNYEKNLDKEINRINKQLGGVSFEETDPEQELFVKKEKLKEKRKGYKKAKREMKELIEELKKDYENEKIMNKIYDYMLGEKEK